MTGVEPVNLELTNGSHAVDSAGRVTDRRFDFQIYGM